MIMNCQLEIQAVVMVSIPFSGIGIVPWSRGNAVSITDLLWIPATKGLVPLSLTWFNFNPNMDK